MERIREIGHLIRNNYLFIVLKVIIIFLLLGVIYIFLLFFKELNDTGSDFKQIYEDKAMYELIDTLVESDDFYQFRHSKDAMKKLQKFYDSLEKDKTFEFLSVFDQPLAVSTFKGDKKFLYGEHQTEYEYEGKVYQDIKCMQMNEKAFDFYDITIPKGHNFKWEEINYKDGKIPVVLGDSYTSIYKIGDKIKGDFYGIAADLEVIGFVEKDSTVFYMNENRYSLNEYIIIPYPSKFFEKIDEDFKAIVYFAMLNGTIAVNNEEGSLQSLLNELNVISKDTGFREYTLIGVPQFVVQYQLVTSTINANKSLIIVVLCFLTLLGIFVLNGLSYFLYQRRRMVYYVYRISGCSKPEIHNMIFSDIGFPYLLSFVSLATFFYMKNQFLPSCIFILALIDFGLMFLSTSYVFYLYKRDRLK